MLKQLLVESIRIDGKTQSREKIDPDAVTEYAEAMKTAGSLLRQDSGGHAEQAWPPLTVFFDGTEYWLADGFHRLLAAQRNGKKNIKAEVMEGTREDAAWAACAANKTHGLRRTNPDKRKAVEMSLKLHPELSDDKIGIHVGVTREFVCRIRNYLNLQPVIGSQVETRLGVDGKVRKVPAKKEKPVQGQGFGPPPTPDENPAKSKTEKQQPTIPNGVPEEEETDEKPNYPKDDLGRRIPDHLNELWNRRQEVQNMLTSLSRVRVTLEKAQEANDPLFSEIPYSTALVHLDQAYNAVQVAKPYAVCAYCQGHGCKACDQRGLLGKFRWDVTVPQEHKDAVARIIEKERSA
jgi:hypothetical protein